MQHYTLPESSPCDTRAKKQTWNFNGQALPNTNSLDEFQFQNFFWRINLHKCLTFHRYSLLSSARWSSLEWKKQFECPSVTSEANIQTAVNEVERKTPKRLFWLMSHVLMTHRDFFIFSKQQRTEMTSQLSLFLMLV